MLREKFENLVLRDQLGNHLPLFDLVRKFEFVVRGGEERESFSTVEEPFELGVLVVGSHCCTLT